MEGHPRLWGASKATLRVHSFLPYSRANGPGLRSALWLQGCSLYCPGCFNPETHSSVGGTTHSVGELANRMVGLAGEVEGLTVSGGEPLQQARPLVALLRRIRRQSNLSVILLTGFTLPEIECRPEARAVLAEVDVLVAGRYRRALHNGHGLRGSTNKIIHLLTDRYTSSDVEHVPVAEVVIEPGGEVLASGLDPLALVGAVRPPRNDR